ncbi:hypothetical protein BGZ65_003161 [Modicella reniformis]|uniref:Ferritin n=1 Tax=Modicella reniformis TaxID=1440133 RepID=A0A9P6ILR7_9FUNG|nr:hypothetical protein BGZ65_003161 [Modicella reniformis]
MTQYCLLLPQQQNTSTTSSTTSASANYITKNISNNMRFSFFAIASAIAATGALAAPIYALTLEYLEAESYKWGLNKYDGHAFEAAGYDSKVRERFVHIGEHESEHVDVLKSVIKSLYDTPVPKCIYKFPLDDVHVFIAIARALENTGISTYIGAAAGLKGDLLTGTASIATVEARRSSRTGAPFAFDTPLTPKEIITIASNFVESCPFDLGITPFKQLTAELLKATIRLSNKATVSRRSECSLAKGVNGYIYVVITDTANPITLKDDSHILAGPALLFYGHHQSLQPTTISPLWYLFHIVINNSFNIEHI